MPAVCFLENEVIFGIYPAMIRGRAIKQILLYIAIKNCCVEEGKT